MNETTSQQSTAEHFGSAIFTYTRAQALEDGVLIDVTEEAKPAGFVLPVALTATVWADCVAWSEADSLEQCHQDESARLWDVLFMAAINIKSRAGSASSLVYAIDRVKRGDDTSEATAVQLKLVIGPGDDSEPVVTIMQPGED
ncbi:MAG: hypothetical protein OXG06_03720 [Gammaproteobacteria bacterium]|nr:hypothetical protein [Gammaproteobacteria bacterium]